MLALASLRWSTLEILLLSQTTTDQPPLRLNQFNLPVKLFRQTASTLGAVVRHLPHRLPIRLQQWVSLRMTSLTLDQLHPRSPRLMRMAQLLQVTIMQPMTYSTSFLLMHHKEAEIADRHLTILLVIFSLQEISLWLPPKTKSPALISFHCFRASTKPLSSNQVTSNQTSSKHSSSCQVRTPSPIWWEVVPSSSQMQTPSARYSSQLHKEGSSPCHSNQWQASSSKWWVACRVWVVCSKTLWAIRLQWEPWTTTWEVWTWVDKAWPWEWTLISQVCRDQWGRTHLMPSEHHNKCNQASLNPVLSARRPSTNNKCSSLMVSSRTNSKILLEDSSTSDDPSLAHLPCTNSQNWDRWIVPNI